MQNRVIFGLIFGKLGLKKVFLNVLMVAFCAKGFRNLKFGSIFRYLEEILRTFLCDEEGKKG